MQRCSAANCTNRSENKDVRVFRFPRNKECRKRWLINMQRANWEPTNNARVCMVHLEESQLELNRADGLKRLKGTVVPTLFNIPNAPLLKNENVLESYTFAVSFREKPEIHEETFTPHFCESIKCFKELLSKYSCLDDKPGVPEYIPSKSLPSSYRETMEWLQQSEANVPSRSFGHNADRLIIGTRERDSQDADGQEISGMNLVEDISKSLPEGAETANVNSKPSCSKDSAQIYRAADGSFLCPFCQKSFSNKSSARRHCKMHSGARRFGCQHCDKAFASKTGLEAHQLRQHNLNADSALSCVHCGKHFIRRSALDVHTKIHSQDKPFPCDVCGRAFTQKVSLSVHLAKHTGKYPYECSICRKSFASRAKLNSHGFVHQTPRFTCELCGRRFVRRDSLLVHSRSLHCRSSEPTESWMCAVCDKTFPSRRSLLIHSEMHSVAHKYKCSECDAQFERRGGSGGLTAHLRTQHCVFLKEAKPRSVKESKAFLCAQCGHTFQKKQSLLEHEQTHLRSEPVRHACQLCPKTFSQKGKLSAHVRTHFEEPSHACSVCGKRFHRRDVCVKHMRAKHSLKPSLPDDHFSLASAAALNTAPAIAPTAANDPPLFQCFDCGQKFKHKNTYTLHRRRHVGDFRYTCPICGKKFVKKDHLQGHCRSHGTDRPFECPTCGKCYKEQKHCREHIRKMHSAGCILSQLVAAHCTETEVADDQMLV